MQKYYKELIKMAENNKCLSTETITEIETLYHNLKKENKEMLESVLPEYTKRAYEFDSIVKDNNC
jgi:O-phosphoseryl-tRNA(Cys) synthetase